MMIYKVEPGSFLLKYNLIPRIAAPLELLGKISQGARGELLEKRDMREYGFVYHRFVLSGYGVFLSEEFSMKICRVL